MSFWHKIVYPRLPILIQNCAISIYGLYWNRRRFGGVFHQELLEFKQREAFTTQHWQYYQKIELRKLLVHAFETVPLYRERFIQLGFTKSCFEAFELKDLRRLPLLSKDDLRQYGTTKLLSSKLNKRGQFFSSSGSTGTPTKILFSERMHQQWTAAFESRIRNWAGLTIQDGRGMIGGRRVVPEGENTGPFYRYNLFERQIYFSAYHINKKNSADYVFAINKYKPAYMTGYAMSNFILARLIEETKNEVSPLKAVITSSEKLTQEMRDTFERVYGCRTYDSYSGVEACSLISECEYGKLHVSPDVGYIEFIKEDGTYAQPGELGEMVCTGFLNYDQPLIRYRIGDVAKLSAHQTCECNRKMPIVDEIIGRTEDVVTGPDGRQMVRFHGIFIDIPSIIEGQIIQHSITVFEIKLVLTKPLTNEEKQIISKRMESQLGKIQINITPVDFIPRTKSGKFKAVISHVSNS